MCLFFCKEVNASWNEATWNEVTLERSDGIPFKSVTVVTFYRFLTFFVRLLIGVLGPLCLP